MPDTPGLIASLRDQAAARAARRSPLVLSGLRGGGKALAVSALVQQAAGPWVVVAETHQRAEALHHDLCFFAGARGVHYFPHWDTIPYDAFSPNKEIVAQRLMALAALLEGACRVLVTTPQALMQAMIPPSLLRALAFELHVGRPYPRAELVGRLVEAGYVRVDLVEAPGEFSARGEIVDLFPTQAEHPVRLDFFDDELESMRLFEVGTQKSFRATDAATVYPASEGVVNAATAERALAALPHHKVGVQPDTYRQVHDYLRQGAPFPGAEQLLPLLYERVGWLHEAIPAGAVVLLDEPERLTQRARDFHDEVLGEHELCLDQGNIALPPDGMFLTPTALERALAAFYRADLVELAVEDGAETVLWPFADNQSLRILAAGSRGDAHATLADLVETLKGWRAEGAAIVLAARSQTGAERLAHLLAEFELGCRQTPHDPAALAELVETPGGNGVSDILVLESQPRHGFRVVDAEGATRFALITEEELLGEKIRQGRLRKSSLQHFIASLGDLREGDLVVHVEYGIGRYEGLRKLEAGQAEGDFLVLAYAGEDKVYVPVHRLNQVQKFTGVEGAAPVVNRLGDGAWQRSKQRAARVIKDMAEELVKVQAARKAKVGHAFAADENMMTEFEEAFPFQETEDQQRAIEEVLADMAGEQPMDRLVCGDVGFGKTEVAMRAAYLAAQNGKQTVMLVPTTILAQQHYDTLRKRFEGFAVEVEVLSRFRSPLEQKDVLARLAEGKVDILVGTHRLLSRDVRPANLGLLVIDEEQRFGVAHKERIKQLRTQVDVVTLSATPIPRTLHMALMGVRELSIINTAPMDRIAIRTRLVKAGDYIIREAVERELRRGGQVFMVHNRVETIHAQGAYLQSILPQVRIAVAHGQMAERQLERVMLSYVNGDIDVLLTTTIIESGLDIPRANTIIVNQADQFGLAQLYQLRGRVGRSNVQAYAYLLISPEKVLTEVARKRLTLLQEFNDLGSGFKIASHDLEIRGAGNLLGQEQSGHINAIGLELYTAMVEEAVSALQLAEAPARPAVECKLELGFPYLLPDTFIPSTPQRLEVYKQLAEVRSEAEMWDIRQVLEDRFGKLPPEVSNLFALLRVRLVASGLGLSALERAGGQLQARFGHPEAIDVERLMDLLQDPARGLQLLPEDKLLLGAMPETPDEIVERLRVLEGIAPSMAA